MFIEINTNSPQPIFEQTIQQIKFAVAAGTVRNGEMIPSVRELAKQLTINPNTITRAYRQLQDDGIVVVRRGMGLEVADDAETVCKIFRKEFFVQKFNTLFTEAVRSGLSKKEIKEMTQRAAE